MNKRRTFLGALLSATALSSLATIGFNAHAEGTKTDDGMSRSESSRSMGAVVDDQTLETKVKTALIGNDQVKARNIEVEVREGVTYLKGNVDSASEARAAVSTAQGVSGVKDVKSALVVQSR